MNFEEEKYLFKTNENNGIKELSVNIFNQNYTPLQKKNNRQFQQNQINKTSKTTNPIKRINALDSSILENNAFTGLENEDLKTDKKLERLEFLLDDLNEKLIVATALQNSEEILELVLKKDALMLEIKKLNSNFSFKGKPQIANKFNRKIKFLTDIFDKIKIKLIDYLINSDLSVCFMPLIKKIKLKSSLERLSALNRNIDELIKLEIPYGERDKRMELIAENINKANQINVRLNKNLKSS